MDGLTIGRNVHYVLTGEEGIHWSDNDAAGKHRMAFVVDVLDVGTGFVELHVLLSKNDKFFTLDRELKLFVNLDVRYSDDKEPGTWHWIERA